MGSLFAFLSAFGFSLANVMIRKGTTATSKNNGAFISMVLTTAISGIVFTIIGLSRGWPIVTWKGVFWFCFAGVLTTFFGRTLLFTSIQLLGSVRATALKRLNPFFAVIFGVALLGEQITTTLILGMFLIFISFALLIYENYKTNQKEQSKEIAASLETGKEQNSSTNNLKKILAISYIYGILSSICYALGYVVRKVGLGEIDEPFFGTFLGAGVGALIFVVMAIFKERYRLPVKAAFTKFEFWLFGAGVATSLGQIFYFIALSKIEVTRVALISSVEVVFTLFLSVILLKKVENLNGPVIIASILSMAGAMILAVG